MVLQMPNGNTRCARLRKRPQLRGRNFVAFLRIHRVIAGGCTCVNYCAFAMCEGVLLWLQFKEPDFEVPSQYSWEILAPRPFKLGGVERKMTARAEPSRKVCTR